MLLPYIDSRRLHRRLFLDSSGKTYPAAEAQCPGVEKRWFSCSDSRKIATFETAKANRDIFYTW
jgi:hypothetical protein